MAGNIQRKKPMDATAGRKRRSWPDFGEGKEKFYVIFVYTLRFRVFGNDFYLFCDH